MEIKTIKQLAEIMSAYNLEELELEQDNSRIHLSRGSNFRPAENKQAEAKASGNAAPAPVAAAPSSEAEYITSPLVGTFYRSTAPDNPPLVSEGSIVKAGDVVCVLEAMKVMNEIKAEKSGVIAKVLLENEAPVEFGQHLFEISAAVK